MIGSIRGQVLHLELSGELIVDVGGIGYRVIVLPEVMAEAQLNSEIQLFTHLRVKEDVLDLYGFSSVELRDVFEALLGASGVGPKVAMAILSVYQPNDLRRIVSDKDVASLTLVPGIGKKTAEKMMLELQSRLEVEMGSSRDPGAGVKSQARQGLVELGYGEAEITQALTGVEDGPVEDVLKAALKVLANR